MLNDLPFYRDAKVLKLTLIIGEGKLLSYVQRQIVSLGACFLSFWRHEYAEHYICIWDTSFHESVHTTVQSNHNSNICRP